MVRLDGRADGGAVALLVAILSTVLFGFAAIVVDLGYARSVKSDAQSSVDAASLAGASILSKDSSPTAPFVVAIKAIKELASENFGTTDADWAACAATPPTARWQRGGSGTDCILFNNDAVNPSKVQVVLPAKHVDSFFGGLLGYHGVDISARAQATIHEEDVPGCALCVMHSLDTSGDVTVDGGSVGGSSSAGSGQVRTGGSITVATPGRITFAAAPTPPGGLSYSSRPIIRPATDPFVGHPMPADGGPTAPFPDPAPTDDETCGPGGVLAAGTYGDIEINATAAAPCAAAGLIVVTGELRVDADSYLLAAAATIQFSCGTRMAPTECATPSDGGNLRIDPRGQLNMSGSPGDFSVVADPKDTASMRIEGGLSVDQAMYARSASVRLEEGGASLSAQGRVSVGALLVDPGSIVTVTAAGGAPLPGPPFVGLFR
jgi:Putative Flp pilus-assembly TadE/G-like